MRQSKAETIEKYRDTFLEGKSDAFIQKFNEKDELKQYISIMNWKSRNKMKNDIDTAEKNSHVEIINLLKEANKRIKNLDDLSTKDSMKIQIAIDNLKSTIDNFNRIKLQKKLQSLVSLKEANEKAVQDLNKQIVELKSQLEN